MREIKFRGIDCDGGFVFGSYIAPHDGNESHFILQKNGYSVEIIKNTLGQFTGLLDRDGVEIYEGDKLGKCKLSIPEIVYCHESIVEFWTSKKGRYDYERLFDLYVDNYSVIGNIHDQKAAK